MLPAETPKLAKWPFILSDAALLGVASLIASQSRPLAGFALWAVVICVVAGAVVLLVPFVADYARRQDEALDERQRALEAISRTVAASAEQIGIAANGLHEIAALAQRNLKSAETLTGALESRAGSHPATADLDKLQAAADKAARAASELARFEAAAQKNFTTASETLAKTTAAIETLNARIAARAVAASIASETPPPRGMPAISTEPFDPPVDSTPPVEAVTPADVTAIAETDSGPETITTQTVIPDKPKRVRKPREKKPEPAPVSDLALNGDAESSSGAATAVLDEPPPAGAQVSEIVERVRTSDGATRLIVIAYIGIGNRLFIRGEGPGLTWETGVPLQFVSIGRWRWETSEAEAPVKFKLYKNDAMECTSLGEQSIDPGQQEEITALF